MRLLLDENLPRKLRNELPGYEVATARQMGWSGVENGDLLDRAEQEFDVLLTADRNLEYQQNFGRRTISVIVLSARSNSLPALRPLIPRILEALRNIRPGTVVRIGD